MQTPPHNRRQECPALSHHKDTLRTSRKQSEIEEVRQSEIEARLKGVRIRHPKWQTSNRLSGS